MEGNTPEMQLLGERMVADGWCVHQVRYLTRIFNVETVTYLSGLQRSTQRTESHEKCLRASNCIAYNIDNDTYETRHADTCNGHNCEQVSVPEKDLVNTIRKGHIPLVSLHHNDESPPRLLIKVHRRQVASQYTAISHVWFDGLGNPKGNALPSCQLQQFELKSLFWMDTLCLPLEKYYPELWKKSLNSMASIYAGASTTMVFDVELRATNADTDECLGRLICSVWMRRSWTLQEGLLSPECTIRFAKSTVTFRTALNDGEWISWQDRERRDTDTCLPRSDAIGNSVRRSLANHLEYQFYRMRELVRLKDIQFVWKLRVLEDVMRDAARHRLLEQQYGTMSGASRPTELRDPGGPTTSAVFDSTPLMAERPLTPTLLDDNLHLWVTDEELDSALSETFVLVWSALTGRSTTKIKDLFLILANVLDMDCSPLLALSPEDRCQSIIFSLPRLPLSLLFVSGRKVESKDYPFNRWVPVELSTDMLTQGSSLQFIHQEDKFADHYLKVEKTSSLQCVLIRDASLLRGGKFAVRVSGVETPLVCTAIESELALLSNTNNEACILVEGDNFSSVRGALLQVVDHQSKVLRLVYRCSITVTRSSASQEPLEVYQIFQGYYARSSTNIFLRYSGTSYYRLDLHANGSVDPPNLPLLSQHNQASPGRSKGTKYAFCFYAVLVLFNTVVGLSIFCWPKSGEDSYVFAALLSLSFILSLIILPVYGQIGTIKFYMSDDSKVQRRSQYLQALVPSDRVQGRGPWYRAFRKVVK